MRGCAQAATGAHAHRGDEHHVILKGRYRMTQGDHVVDLGPSDYVLWDGTVPHDAQVTGDEEGRILIITMRGSGSELSRPPASACIRRSGRRATAELDLRSFEALTFDCYGTLIDWEVGIAGGLREVLGARAELVADEELLEAYARHEAETESGPYVPYREVLARSLLAVAQSYRVEPTDGQLARFSDSVGDWPPFRDSPAALERLGRRFRLGVITNCDDDLFARSAARLGVAFEWVVTAEQVGSYKPAVQNFEVAIERIGLPPERILHVAQSLFHDHVPAKALGLSTVWVDRRRGRPGFGATPPAEATPDLTVPNLATLADLAGA